MATTKKKSFSRKDIKEDKLVSLYVRAREFYDDYRNHVNIALGVTAAIVVAIFFYMNNVNVAEEKAALEVSRMMPAYDQGKYLEAIEGQPGTPLMGFEKIVDEYSGTESGETAKIYLANSYYFLGKTTEAREYYEDYDGEIDMMKAASLAGLAACDASEGNWLSAAENYLDAADVSPTVPLTPSYLLNAGINYIEAGELEKAKEVLNRAKENYARSVYLQNIGRYLAQVQ